MLAELLKLHVRDLPAVTSLAGPWSVAASHLRVNSKPHAPLQCFAAELEHDPPAQNVI